MIPAIIAILALPLLTAVLVAATAKTAALKPVVWIGGLATLAASVAAAALLFEDGLELDLSVFAWFSPCLLIAEVIIAAYIIYRAIRAKSVPAALFAGAQIALTVWYDLTHDTEGDMTVYIDRLSVLMILIIGVIGSLIAIYSVAYMRDYHARHKDIPDRRGTFTALLFAFLSAMFGLVIANDMPLMLLCWEITSLCSFLLIGYTRTDEAKKNANLALNINVGGGLCFAIGIVILGVFFDVSELTQLFELEGDVGPAASLAAFTLALAGLTKSAQLPFSQWLRGAMVAPTPSSALLHSSTMVKAGVYLLIRLAPLLGGTVTGITVTAIGGLTFLITAIIAVSKSDAKEILAYSTISNLGLIVVCAGIGTAEAQWAAIMLIVFHAIAKSLLFMAVGTAEHQTGSRDVETMDGLYRVSASVTACLTVGIVGMFIAPFGMLISKWAAMRAFIDSGNVPVVLIVAYGGAVTLFFWTKWLGKLLSGVRGKSPGKHNSVSFTEKATLIPLAALVVAVCLAHPLVSRVFITPYLESIGLDAAEPISILASALIISMLCALFVLPVLLFPLYHRRVPRITSVYMAGANAGDDENFDGSMGEPVRVELKNWYMRDFWHTDKFSRVSVIICAGVLIAGFFAVIGGFGL